MKTIYLILSFLVLASCSSSFSDAEDIKAIRNILADQQKAWSNYDLEGFMNGYWKSDSLTYFSGGKITQGWQVTLDNYRKKYSSPAETGALRFEIDNITKINDDAYWVMGEYFLTRKVGDINGTFMIVLKRIHGEWKIIGDSSC